MDLPSHQHSEAAVSPVERRRFPRRSVQVQIELHQEGSDVPLRMETTDLSRGGCYVQLMMPLSVGTYVNATLWICDSAVRIRGRVVTRHPQFGNGIMFLEFQGNGEQLLARYLDGIVE
ncbi:MAG: PilZ domain-containing protein [Terriglobales bacterium]|jgi:c-di-GMP-binding flagellar brake protein YcgR